MTLVHTYMFLHTSRYKIRKTHRSIEKYSSEEARQGVYRFRHLLGGKQLGEVMKGADAKKRSLHHIQGQPTVEFFSRQAGRIPGPNILISKVVSLLQRLHSPLQPRQHHRGAGNSDLPLLLDLLEHIPNMRHI